MTLNLDQFDEEAKALIARAQSLATELENFYVGLEHLLLAYIVGSELFRQKLSACGVSPEKYGEALRQELAAQQNAHPWEELMMSPRCRRVLGELCQEIKAGHIGEAALLERLGRECWGTAPRRLRDDFGVELAQVVSSKIPPARGA